MVPVFYLKIVSAGDTVSVTGMKQLVADNATQFKVHVAASLFAGQKFINVEMREVTRIDNPGLHALLSFQPFLDRRNGVMRLINPDRAIEQELELILACHPRQFEVVHRAPVANDAAMKPSSPSLTFTDLKITLGWLLAHVPTETSLLQFT